MRFPAAWWRRAALLAVGIAIGIWGIQWPAPPRPGDGRGPAPPARALPSVVIISIDTLRADHLGCYGYPRPVSPAIDALAREAVLFADANAQANNTAPSHMTMLTGVSPAVHGVYGVSHEDDTFPSLSPAIPTLAEILNSEGYTTIGLTGGGNVGALHGFDRGFDRYTEDFFEFKAMYAHSGAAESRCLEQVRAAVRDARTAGRPLFLFLHHYLCHSIYLAAPAGYRERFARELAPRLPRSIADLGGLDDERLFFRRFRGDVARDRAHLVALYDGAVAYSDYLVSAVIDQLRAAGAYDETLLVVTADHGEQFYDHGDWRHEQLWREVVRVPLLIKFPRGEHGGRVITAPARTMDLTPTVLAAAGLPVPALMQGEPLQALLADSSPVRQQFSYKLRCDDDGQPRIMGVRVRGDSGVWFWHDDQPARDYLFADQDTAEARNLAATRTAARERLRAQAAARLAADRAWRERLHAEHPGPAE